MTSVDTSVETTQKIEDELKKHEVDTSVGTTQKVEDELKNQEDHLNQEMAISDVPSQEQQSGGTSPTSSVFFQHQSSCLLFGF